MDGQPWRQRLERDLERAVAQIVRNYAPERIVVYGSVARGDAHEDSDIDLLIIKETDRSFLQRIDDVLSLLRTEVAVEPIIYTPDEIKRLMAEGRDFIETIVAEGRVVYDRQSGSEPAGGRPVASHR